MNTPEIKKKEAFSDNNIFDLAPFPMWIFDLNTLKFLAVNKEAIRQYGFTETEFLSMTIENIRPVDDIPKLETAIARAKNRTELFNESLFRHQKKNGDVINVHIKSNLITYKGNKAEIVTAIDITERHREQIRIKKQTEYLETIDEINDTLLKSEEWSSALIHCFKRIGETLDIDKISFFQNDAIEKTTSQQIRWSRNSVESYKVSPNLQNLPLSQFPLYVEPLQKGENFHAIVSELPSSPTKNILLEEKIKSVLVAPVISSDSFIGFIAMNDCSNERNWSLEEFQLIKALTTNLAHVITQNKIHAKLVSNEYKFRTLVQKSSDLIAIVDKEGTFKYVNHSSIEVLGIHPDDFIENNALDFIHPEDVAMVEACLQEVTKTEGVSIPPFRFPDINNEWIWLETQLTNFLDDPVVSGILANSRVVTSEIERKRENDLINSISKAVGQPGSLKRCLGEATSEFLKLPNICVAETWLKSPDGSRLDFRTCNIKQNEFQLFCESPSRIKSLSFSEGFPGYIWKNRKFIIWDLPKNELFIRRAAAVEVGFKSAIGIPINYNEEFIGCFILYSQQNINELRDVEKMLKNIGDKLGAVVKQKIVEDEYRNFFEVTPDPHCILGFDGKLKKVNPGFSQLLGFEEAELLHKPISSFIYEKDREKAQQKIESSLANRASGSFTVRFKTKQGDTKWLIWTGTTISEAKIFIAVAKDVTEQKSAERELRSTYNRLKKAQKLAKLGYFTKKMDADLSEWSEETYEIFGYTRENFEPTFENVFMAYHPDDRHLIKGDPKSTLVPGEAINSEIRIIHSSGEVRWVQHEISLKTDVDGKPLQIEGTIQDITERKEREEQLKISNERFRLAMMASNEIIWEIDHARGEILRGAGYNDLLKYNISEAHDQLNSWYKKIYFEDKNRVWNTFQDALMNPEKTEWKEEYRIVGENEKILYFIDRCHIIKDKKGNALRSIGSALDITVSRQQLEQIKIQNKNLRDIAWLQSHVIRAPLVRILGLIELVKEFEGGGKSYEEIFDMISTSAQELDKVIHEIAFKTDIVEENGKRDLIN